MTLNPELEAAKKALWEHLNAGTAELEARCNELVKANQEALQAAREIVDTADLHTGSKELSVVSTEAVDKLRASLLSARPKPAAPPVRCLARRPHSEDWQCNKPKGHSGGHAELTFLGDVRAAWPNEPDAEQPVERCSGECGDVGCNLPKDHLVPEGHFKDHDPATPCSMGVAGCEASHPPAPWGRLEAARLEEAFNNAVPSRVSFGPEPTESDSTKDHQQRWLAAAAKAEVIASERAPAELKKALGTLEQAITLIGKRHKERDLARGEAQRFAAALAELQAAHNAELIVRYEERYKAERERDDARDDVERLDWLNQWLLSDLMIAVFGKTIGRDSHGGPRDLRAAVDMARKQGLLETRNST